MSEFESAILRIDRARVLAKEMSEVWNEYLTPHPFDSLLYRESPTRYVLRVQQLEPVPNELSVIFGEWLQNMRSALDYTIWATAVYTSGKLPPPGEAALQYPIFDTSSGWDKNLQRLRPLADHHREMLRTMQPFNSDSDANYLGWINRLARVDRHRRLASWTARIAEANPAFMIPSGVEPQLEWGQKTFRNRVCDFARITFPDEESGNGVQMNPRVGIDPEIAEWSTSPFWGRYRFSDRLQLMHVFLYAEVGLYEYDCTGASMHEGVSDSFRAESDARRNSGFFPALTRIQDAPIEWKPSGPSKPSSRATFRGDDFPTEGPARV